MSRDDFIAVQQMLDNAKYRNKSFLPQLRVIDSGIFKGYVVVNPRWAGFSVEDYYRAAQSVYYNENGEPDVNIRPPDEIEVEVNEGDFDLRGFEVVRCGLFDTSRQPHITFSENTMKLGAACVKKYGKSGVIELLVNPITKHFAVRSTDKGNRNSVCCATTKNGKLIPKTIHTTAFQKTLFSLFEWKNECRYKMIGTLYEQDAEIAYIFDVADAEAYFKPNYIPSDSCDAQPLIQVGKRIKAVPEDWTYNFGTQYYFHKQSIEELEKQSESDWKLHLEGRLFETGKHLNVTGFNELRNYIRQELSDITDTEEYDE